MEVTCNNTLFPHIPKTIRATLYQANMRAKSTLHIWLPKNHRATFFSDGLNTESQKSKTEHLIKKTWLLQAAFKNGVVLLFTYVKHIRMMWQSSHKAVWGSSTHTPFTHPHKTGDSWQLMIMQCNCSLGLNIVLIWLCDPSGFTRIRHFCLDTRNHIWLHYSSIKPADSITCLL